LGGRVLSRDLWAHLLVLRRSLLIGEFAHFGRFLPASVKGSSTPYLCPICPWMRSEHHIRRPKACPPLLSKEGIRGGADASYARFGSTGGSEPRPLFPEALFRGPLLSQVSPGKGETSKGVILIIPYEGKGCGAGKSAQDEFDSILTLLADEVSLGWGR